MSTTAFYTRAYNAEKTVRQAIESVLCQTRADFSYYLIENGSTDGTREIIKSYAAQDARIKPIYEDKNNPRAGVPILKAICKEYQYYAVLDADDEYLPDFHEKTLSFLEENDLDIATCGSYFIDAQSGDTTGIRKFKHDFIIKDAAEFSEFFTSFHLHMRPLWGKLYRVSTLKKFDFENYKLLAKAGTQSDTLFNFKVMQVAERFGILALPLHKYYLSSGSGSRIFDEKRISADRILDDETRAVLLDKCGVITPQNDRFLGLVYTSCVKDTIKILVKSKNPVNEKLAGLQNIIFSKHTKRAMDSPELDNRKRGVFELAMDWLLAQNICRETEGAKGAAEMIVEMYPQLMKITDKSALVQWIIEIPESMVKVNAFELIVDWLLSQSSRSEDDGASKVAEIIMAMYPQMTMITDKNALVQLIREVPETVMQMLREYSNLGL